MINKSKVVVIASAVRTPIGTYKGSLKNMKSHHLGAIVIKEVLKRSEFKKDEIDEVIMGQVLTAGAGQNPARQASIDAGIPITKPAHIVNQVCGSGLRAVISAYQSIKLGESLNIIAGGQENMSIAPHSIFYRDNKKISEKHLVDTMINDGLIDAFNNYHMGVTAENVAKKFNISRVDQDDFALNSQKKTENAINTNRFEEELVKINQPGINLDTDEHPKYDTTIESLSNLKTVFKNDGSVTAGNASGINDGASALVLANEKQAKKGKPMAKIISYGFGGVEPDEMGLGPIPASKMALKKVGLSIDDLDLVESNEAFAAQACAVNKELGLDEAKVNVNGGAIALGHPVGATGSIIMTKLVHELKRRNGKYGLATMCIGGGHGIAVIIENC